MEIVSENLVRKFFPPPNSAPGLRHCPYACIGAYMQSVIPSCIRDESLDYCNSVLSWSIAMRACRTRTDYTCRFWSWRIQDFLCEKSFSGARHACYSLYCKSRLKRCLYTSECNCVL